MTERLSALNLPFTFVEAVDGRQFNIHEQAIYDGARRRRYMGRDLTGGDLGCIMTHKKIIQDVADKNQAAIVLEDDAVLHPDFPDVVRALMESNYPWEFIRFLGSPKVAKLRQRTVAYLNGPYRITRLSTTPGGSHAYIVRPSGARKLLARLNKVAFPIDMTMGRGWETGMGILTVQPGMATQDLSFVSDIGEARHNKKALGITGWRRVIFPATRMFYKSMDGVMKRWSYFSAYARDINSAAASRRR